MSTVGLVASPKWSEIFNLFFCNELLKNGKKVFKGTVSLESLGSVEVT